MCSNGRVPIVYDLFEDAHGHEKRVPNREQSLLAQEKWRRIAERFSAGLGRISSAPSACVQSTISASIVCAAATLMASIYCYLD